MENNERVYTDYYYGSASISVHELVTYIYRVYLLYCFNKQHVDLGLWSNWCTVCVTCICLNFVICFRF